MNQYVTYIWYICHTHWKSVIHVCVTYESYTCVTYESHICDVLNQYVTYMSYICHTHWKSVIHTCVWQMYHIYVTYWFICVTHTAPSSMTHSYVWHVSIIFCSFICVTWKTSYTSWAKQSLSRHTYERAQYERDNLSRHTYERANYERKRHSWAKHECRFHVTHMNEPNMSDVTSRVTWRQYVRLTYE